MKWRFVRARSLGSNSARAHRNTYTSGCWNLFDCQRGHEPEDQVTQEKNPQSIKELKTNNNRKKEIAHRPPPKYQQNQPHDRLIEDKGVFTRDEFAVV